MKYTAAAALLPLLASAANINARQATDLKYEISDFSAACTTENNYCFYGLSIVTSDNPDFKVSCDAPGTSDNGELPAVGETQCGTYTVSVSKSDDGGLVLTVNSNRGRLTGTHSIPGNDLESSTSGDRAVQSYKGDTSFVIDVKNASSASGTSTITATPTASSSPSDSSSASSVSSTAASGPSTTTSDSAGPSETSGATRERAFAGVMFSVGLLAFMI